MITFGMPSFFPPTPFPVQSTNQCHWSCEETPPPPPPQLWELISFITGMGITTAGPYLGQSLWLVSSFLD